MKRGRKPIPVSGRFGKLVVNGEPTSDPKRRNVLWPLLCDCGEQTFATSFDLRRGKVQSCGCGVIKHGETRHGVISPEYTAWNCMLNRCYYPNDVGYPNYGGRGIVVCVRWRNSVEAFIKDVGRRPSTDHSVDRINSNGNYEPGNVKWSTTTEQNQNKRSLVMLTVDGETTFVAEWSRRTGVQESTIMKRVKTYGWSHERAVKTPGRSKKAA